MTSIDLEVAAALGRAIAQRIGEPRYQLWFAHNTRLAWDDAQLTVGVPNHFFQEWLQSTFGAAVVEAAAEVLLRPMQVQFVIDPALFQAARRAQEDAAISSKDVPPAPSAPAPAPPSTAESSPSRPRREARRKWKRLEDFVVGACNRLAHAAAVSIVEAPEATHPLVLHGPVGTGKTHLLEGICIGLRRGHPSWQVVFVTAEEFTNRFVQAMRLGKLGTFRRQFRDADVLIVDDLHFLAGKKATQEEFLHTFDVLVSDGRPLVVSCAVHPRLADELTPELIDRLMGGAVSGLLPPDADTRLALLRARIGRGDMPVADDVLRLMASSLRGNVRELEGALHALRHAARVGGRVADAALAREVLADVLRHCVRVVRLEDVDRAVCKVLRLEAGALQTRHRGWAISHPRMLAMFLARRHTAAAHAEIGRYFGKRNHSTVIAAERKVHAWIEADEELTLGERRLRVRLVVEQVERELE